MVLKVHTWEREDFEIAKREDAKTWDSIEVRDNEIALHYSNGIFQGKIRGRKTKWNPLGHDEIIWIALTPFKIKSGMHTLSDETSTELQISAEVEISDPKLFADNMVKGRNVTILDIKNWLEDSLQDVISEIESAKGTPSEEEKLKVLSYLKEQAKLIGLEIRYLHPPRHVLSEEIVEAKEDLNVAPLKRDNFNVRIDAILSAMERVQRPEQEIRLKAIEALREWANKPQSNISITAGTPWGGVFGAGTADEIILRRLIDYFEKDTGANKIADALKEILTDTDFMGLTKQTAKLQQTEEPQSINSGKFDATKFKSALVEYVKSTIGYNASDITIKSFKLGDGYWEVKGSYSYFTDPTEYERLSKMYDDLEKSFLNKVNKNRLFNKQKELASQMRSVRIWKNFQIMYDSTSNSIIGYKEVDWVDNEDMDEERKERLRGISALYD